MHILPLESSIIYGPLYSRRLDRSLGLNILPTEYKLCSFDCVYCHYGRTQVKTLAPEGHDFPSVPRVLKAIQKALGRYPNVPYLTFSGNGEPTLHPHFPEIVDGIRCLRPSLAPDLKLAIFSNATTVMQPDLRAPLQHFAAPILKLDAGDPETFAAVNRPAPAVELSDIIAGMQEIPNLIIQSVLIDSEDGEVSNIHPAALEAWIEALVTLQPTRVQIYSTDYPVPDAGVERVPPYKLQQIAEQVQERTGLTVTPLLAVKNSFVARRATHPNCPIPGFCYNGSYAH